MTFTHLLWAATLFMAVFFLLMLHKSQRGNRDADESVKLFFTVSFIVWFGVFGSYQLIKASTPLRVVSLGTLVNARAGSVETTAGFYSVIGAVSGDEGDPVQRTYHHLGIVQICVAQRCYPEWS